MKDEVLGLDILQEQKIKCSNCGTPLAEVLVMESNEQRKERDLKPIKSSFRINNCTKCSNGGSFIHGPFEGTTSVGTFKDNLLVDVEDTDILTDGTIMNILTIRNR
jgi:hypothetical protein